MRPTVRGTVSCYKLTLEIRLMAYERTSVRIHMLFFHVHHRLGHLMLLDLDCIQYYRGFWDHSSTLWRVMEECGISID